MSKDTLKADESFGVGGSLVSKNGKFVLQLQEDENMVFYERTSNGDKPLWATNTQDSFAVSAVMQSDGNFVLYDNSRRPQWRSNTNGKGDKSSFVQIPDEGNIFIFSGGKEIWRALQQSVRPPPASTTPLVTPQPVPKPTVPTPQPVKPVNPTPVAPPVDVVAAVATSALTTLRGGQSLTLKQSISSPNGKVSLVLQEDGNLVVNYRDGNNNKVLWSAETFGKSVATARLRVTGEFSLLKSDSTRVWSSDTSRAGNTRDAVLLVQDDGHVVIFAGGTRIWRTMTPKLPGTDPDRLNADQYLEPDQKIVSPNGKTSLVFQGDRNLCLYTDTFVGALWSKVTEDRETRPSKVIMRADDDLWYGDKGSREWTSTTRRRKGNGDAFLQVMDTGVIVIKSEGLIIWSSDEKKAQIDIVEPITTVAGRGNKLKAGEHLRVTDNIVSKNGQFQAWLSEQGNFCIFRRVGNGEWQFLWSSKTSGSWVSKVAVIWTGELIVFGANAKKLWAQGAANTEGEAELTMQDDGNLVLARDGNNLWTAEINFPASIKQVDRIRYGEWFAIDQSLTSANGQYTLTLQANANFCITKKSDNSKVFTNAAKNVTGAQLMCFDKESNDLVIYNKDGKQTQREGKVLWKAENTSSFAWNGATEFIMQDDGNAVLYMKGEAVWAARNNLAPGSTMAPAPPGPDSNKIDWSKGGPGTNSLRPGQVLKAGQSLYADLLRTIEFGIDFRGLLYVKFNKSDNRMTIWTGGTDNARPNTPFLLITDKGELQIRGILDPNEGGDGTEKVLWFGGKPLVAPSRDVLLLIEEDGTPAVYNGTSNVLWRPPNWRRAGV